MPRPTHYTPETVKRIMEALAAGASYKMAAAYGGISYETFRTWRAEFPAFSAAIEKAEAEAVVGRLEVIDDAAVDGNWQAAAWWLERKYPDEWGRKDRLELDIRREAEKLARRYGLEPGQIISLADRISKGA